MRTLVRRIEILESYAARQRVAAARSIDKAVDDFYRGCKAGQLELLISAFAGERTGRPLTPDETEVMKQFWEHAQRRFQRDRIPLPATASPEIVISAAARVALFDVQDKQGAKLALHFSGLEAVHEGREPTQEERAAMHTYTPVCAHLTQLAGFCSIEELDECLERRWEEGQPA
jgi:hypothetical protein